MSKGKKKLQWSTRRLITAATLDNSCSEDTIDAQRTKRTLMQFAEKAGPDHPAYLRRVIRAFIAHYSMDT